MFVPKRIYYEKRVRDYAFGRELLDRYLDMGIPGTVIESHNNIHELRTNPNAEFARMKDYLILGVRKTLKYVPNSKTSDYLVPYTSSGCSAKCLYCYLVCNYNKCSYLRVFVNREEMMGKLIGTADGSEKELTFEIGSNSDLVLENSITGNLVWTVNRFAEAKKGFITFPTKFHQIEPILGLDHKGRTIIRMSVNPHEIIKRVEFGTSPLAKRITAVNDLKSAGYKIGLLVAPVVIIEDWKALYRELFVDLADTLSPAVKRDAFFEIIFMTYSYIHRMINREAFPNTVDLYDPQIMTARGRGKYTYNRDVRQEGTDFMMQMMNEYFPGSVICYIV